MLDWASSFCHVRFPSRISPKRWTRSLAVGQHIGQLAHFLCIGDRLVEGNREIVGAEDGEVGVVALEVLVGMSIHHRQVVIIVLLADEAAGIWQKVRTLFLKGFG